MRVRTTAAPSPAPRATYRSNIRRHLLGTPIIARRLRELFSKWNGKKNGRGVPFLMSDFQETLTFS